MSEKKVVRNLFVGLFALALLLPALFGDRGADAADGVPNDVSNQVVGDISIYQESGGDQIRLYDFVSVSIDLDSRVNRDDPSDPANAVDEGDTFTVALPEEFKASDTTFNLTADSEILATCSVETNVIVCTFTAAAAAK